MIEELERLRQELGKSTELLAQAIDLLREFSVWGRQQPTLEHARHLIDKYDRAKKL